MLAIRRWRLNENAQLGILCRVYLGPNRGWKSVSSDPAGIL